MQFPWVERRLWDRQEHCRLLSGQRKKSLLLIWEDGCSSWKNSWHTLTKENADTVLELSCTSQHLFNATQGHRLLCARPIQGIAIHPASKDLFGVVLFKRRDKSCQSRHSGCRPAFSLSCHKAGWIIAPGFTATICQFSFQGWACLPSQRDGSCLFQGVTNAQPSTLKHGVLRTKSPWFRTCLLPGCEYEAKRFADPAFPGKFLHEVISNCTGCAAYLVTAVKLRQAGWYVGCSELTQRVGKPRKSRAEPAACMKLSPRAGTWPMGAACGCPAERIAWAQPHPSRKPGNGTLSDWFLWSQCCVWQLMSELINTANSYPLGDR